jgi:cell wall-associated NlpC family hydrolase
MEDFIFGYSQADEKSPKVSDLVAGNILKGKKEATTFSRVTFPDGRVAFVKSSMLMNYNDWLASRKPEEEEILKSAFEMMGRPYLWGGTSGKGVDCSGFTKMVYYLNGVQLPRDANQQADVGEDVPSDTTFSNLLPGDLLFFGRKATEGEKERITHVGIYLGNGKMIHSSNMVEIGGLRRGEPDFSEYRLTSFVRARRMIGVSADKKPKLLTETGFY